MSHNQHIQELHHQLSDTQLDNQSQIPTNLFVGHLTQISQISEKTRCGTMMVGRNNQAMLRQDKKDSIVALKYQTSSNLEMRYWILQITLARHP